MALPINADNRPVENRISVRRIGSDIFIMNGMGFANPALRQQRRIEQS
jgi:hypothetical protein